MSRIGKKPVKIVNGVKVAKDGDNFTVTGPKGTLSLYVNPIITSEVKADEVQFSRSSDIKRDKALHGLYAILLKNMITGVTEGFTKKLELVGIGYRAELKSNKLFLSLGFSHPLIFNAPDGITITVPNDNTILIS